MNNTMLVNEVKQNNESKNRIKNKKKISELCQHNYIMDLIDIDPDRSQIIYYCDKCGEFKK